MKLSNLTRTITRLAAVLVCAIAVGPSAANAGVYSQIADPFTPFDPGVGFQFAFSQNDTDPGLTPPSLATFAIVYDNFSFADNVFATDFSWIGGYSSIGGAPAASSFTLDIFDDVGGAPGTSLFSADVGLANETSIPDGGGNPSGFFSYSTSISPFALTGGEDYWFSVIANLDANFNAWGLAFSPVGGDDNSYQDFGLTSPPGLTRFNDPFDYAFAVQATAVPEPSSALTLLGLGVVVGLRRRR